MEIKKIKLVFNSLYAVQKTLEREKGKEVGELTKLIAKYLGEPDFCKTLEDIYPLWKKYSQMDVLSDEFWDEIQKETQSIWTKHKHSQLSFRLCDFMLEEFNKKATKTQKQIIDYAIERSERTGIEIETKYYSNFKSKKDVDIFLAERSKNEMSKMQK